MQPTNIKSKNNYLGVAAIIFLSGLLVLCNLSIVVIFFSTKYFSENIPEIVINTNLNQPRNYIDPEIDSEAELLIQNAKEHFEVTYEIAGNTKSYATETDFILANLQHYYDELSARFDHNIDEKIKVVITNSQKQYETEFGVDFDTDFAYAGLTNYRRILFLISDDIDFDYYKENMHFLLGHELVHVFQYEAFQNLLISYPTWFGEGTAEYFSHTKPYDFDTNPSVLSLNTLEKLNDTFYSEDTEGRSYCYIVANMFTRYLAEQKGEENLTLLLFPENTYYSFDNKFIEIYGQSADMMYESWFERTFIEE